MKRKILLAITFTAIFSLFTFGQSGGGKAVRVRFAKGASAAKYKGTASHSSDAYFLSAKRGQTLIVKISGSGEPAFHLGSVPRGSTNSQNYNSINSTDLKTLTYKINTDDDLAILVGAVRGSASYTLTITVK